MERSRALSPWAARWQASEAEPTLVERTVPGFEAFAEMVASG
jgi:hypothetical protein